MISDSRYSSPGNFPRSWKNFKNFFLFDWSRRNCITTGCTCPNFKIFLNPSLFCVPYEPSITIDGSGVLCYTRDGNCFLVCWCSSSGRDSTLKIVPNPVTFLHDRFFNTCVLRNWCYLNSNSCSCPGNGNYLRFNWNQIFLYFKILWIKIYSCINIEHSLRIVFKPQYWYFLFDPDTYTCILIIPYSNRCSLWVSFDNPHNQCTTGSSLFYFFSKKSMEEP